VAAASRPNQIRIQLAIGSAVWRRSDLGRAVRLPTETRTWKEDLCVDLLSCD
jgi:hypothetical protein